MDKKGNMDNLTIPIVLLYFCVFIVAAYIIVSSVGNAFDSSTEASNLLSAGKLMFSRIGNASFIFIVVALLLLNIIGAFLMISHPVFIVVDIIMMPLSVLMAVIMSNAYEASLATLSVASAFSVMTFVMSQLPIIIVVADIVTAIAAYALIKQ